MHNYIKSTNLFIYQKRSQFNAMNLFRWSLCNWTETKKIQRIKINVKGKRFHSGRQYSLIRTVVFELKFLLLEFWCFSLFHKIRSTPIVQIDYIHYITFAIFFFHHFDSMPICFQTINFRLHSCQFSIEFNMCKTLAFLTLYDRYGDEMISFC